MSHCKTEHLVLVLYVQKNFTATSKTVYIYVFSLFLSELTVVKMITFLFWETTTETLFEIDLQCQFGWLYKTE